MSSEDVVISVRNIGKCYQIYSRPHDRLLQTLFRGRKQFYREFWALRDVNFDIRRGESVGIIGRNGSGKSTLLQVIAGTLQPTNGEVAIRGKVGALLELGGGMNPEYTGRENVGMQASIMGLDLKEANARIGEVEQFAELGQFFDQPVKTYSSGMFVRLAFAIQVLLRPEVLIVDEALAVGDAAFQMKCMNHMHRLQESGTSIILVTHDVSTVRSFCQRAIWLEQGAVKMNGCTQDTTARYIEYLFTPLSSAAQSVSSASGDVGAPDSPTPVEAVPQGEASVAGQSSEPQRGLSRLSDRADIIRWGSGEMMVTGVTMYDGQGGGTMAFKHGCPLHIEIEVVVYRPLSSPNVGLGFAIRNTKGLDIITFTTWEAGFRFPTLEPGCRYRLAFDLDNILSAGDYALVVNVEYICGTRGVYMDFVENAVFFCVMTTYPIWSLTLPMVKHRVLETARVRPEV